MWQVFRQLDIEGDGQIDVVQLRKTLANYPSEGPVTDISYMVTALKCCSLTPGEYDDDDDSDNGDDDADDDDDDDDNEMLMMTMAPCFSHFWTKNLEPPTVQNQELQSFPYFQCFDSSCWAAARKTFCLSSPQKFFIVDL